MEDPRESDDLVAYARIALGRSRDKEDMRRYQVLFDKGPNRALLRSDRFFEIIGTPTRLAVYAALAIGLIWSMPDIGNKPLASIKFGELVAYIFLLPALYGLGTLLCNPSQEPEVRQLWGQLGLLVICVIVGLFGLLVASFR